MRSWKTAFTGILIGYLIAASALSLAMDYLASGQLRALAEDASRTEKAPVPVPQCDVAPQGQDSIVPPPAPSANRSAALGRSGWDASIPDDISGRTPQRCDDYFDQMTRALEE